MVAKKRASKRQTLQTKYKIVKRTKQHEKRVKKGLLKKFSNKQKASDHIPNAWPYKEDLLMQIKAAKEKMELVKQAKKEKVREERAKRKAQLKKMKSGEYDEDDDMDEEEEEEEEAPVKNKLLMLGKTGNVDQDHFETEDGYELGKDTVLGKNSRRAYLKELRKTVEGADVILQVLDARDPMGTMSTAVQEMVVSKGNKKLVYILNKSDLVPRDVLAGWLAYLRRSHPTVPFKSNTQTGQAKNLGRGKGNIAKNEDSSLKTNRAVGTEELIGLLKNYSRVGDTKSQIVVGIVGFPNVGKSSLINSLMRSRAVGVSSMPGFTKVAQEVVLDKNIRLMDSPGIVFADGDTAATALRNCVNVEEMEDVMTPLQAIMDRCPQGYLMQLYNISTFKKGDATSFLALVARASGKLKKGGTPNIDQAARVVLHDWNNGKIKYYCKAPSIGSANRGEEEESEARVLSGFSDETDMVRELRPEDARVLDELEGMQNTHGITSFIGMDQVAEGITAFDENSSTATTKSASSSSSSKGGKTKQTALMEEEDDIEEDDDDEDEEDEEEEEEEANKKKRARGNERAKRGEAVFDDTPTVDPRKAQKKATKAAKKATRKGGSQAYDFSEYF
jgi:nuclear GTP-binding protein